MPRVDRAPPGEPTALDDELAAVIAEVRAGREPGEATTFGVALRVFLARLRLSLTVVAGHTEIGEDTLGLARAGRPQRYLTPEQISQLVITLADLYPERLSLARYSAWLVALHGLVAVERTLGYLRRSYGGATERLDARLEARLRLDLRALLLGTVRAVVEPDLERLRLSHAGRRPVGAAGAADQLQPRERAEVARPEVWALAAPQPPMPAAPLSVSPVTASDAAAGSSEPPAAGRSRPVGPTGVTPSRPAALARAMSPLPRQRPRPDRADQPPPPAEAAEATPLDAAADADALLLIVDEAAAPDLLATLRAALARLRRR